MSDYKQSTSSRPPNRKSTLLTARRMYSLVFDGLAQADRALSNMVHVLRPQLTDDELYPYLVEIVKQRGGIHQALGSSLVTIDKIFPAWVREQHRREQKNAKRKR